MVDTICDSESTLPPPDGVLGEAAVWVAKLHSDVRTGETEVAFRGWLAASPVHRSAFARMTGVWESTANLRRGPTAYLRRPREFRRAFRRALLVSAATLAACALIAVGAIYLVQLSADYDSETLATALGQRRSLRLADGSHLQLNTSSLVKVAFNSRVRKVTLEEGQARFEVVRDPTRPFVVRAGDRQIVALGTAFDVRWTDERLSIVLVEGHVAIMPAAAPLTAAAVSSAAVTLEAGERLEFQGPALAVKSTVRLDREEAWVRGRVVFDATRLSTAIAEMNRYAPQRIQLANPALADLLISGTFSVDDPNAFARAVAQIFSLQISEVQNGVLISSP